MQWNISTLLKIYSTERRNPREIFSSTFSKIVVKLLNLPENALPLKLKKMTLIIFLTEDLTGLIMSFWIN